MTNMKNILLNLNITVILLLLLFPINFAYGQGTTCANATAAPTNCTTGYTVSNTAGISASPQCVGNVNPSIDGWYTWTPAAGTYDIDLGGGGGGKDVGIAIYSGTCADLTSEACSNLNDAGDSPETINPFIADGSTTYYIQIFKVSGSNAITGTFCITQIPQTISNTCSATFYDPGGAGGSATLNGVAGNYPNNSQNIYTFCSNDPGNPYVSLNFSQFALENGFYDFITIYDGASMDGTLILGNYTGAENPGIVTSSTGCLTVYFTSDVIINRLGWQAAVTCTSIQGVLPTPTIADCLGAIGLCGTSSTNVSGNGAGTYDDLSSANDGCLLGEHNTVWYFLKIDDADGDGNPLTSGTGTLGFTLTMPNQVDYDYAMWGPLAGSTPEDFCTPSNMPSRCSYSVASGNSNTTMGINSTNDPDQISENAGASEDGWLYYYDEVQDGEVYLLMIDRWGSDVHDYTLSFNGTASGAGGLDCSVVPLPTELHRFEGFHISRKSNYLQWTTTSEINSDYFKIERSANGVDWNVIATMNAAGNSNTSISYSLNDDNYYSPLTYYRLTMVDMDGSFSYSEIIAISSSFKFETLFSDVVPNPASDNAYIIYGGTNYNTDVIIELISNEGKILETINMGKMSKGKSISLDFSKYSQGLYYLNILQGTEIDKKKISIIR